jgi:hypothetical protein
MVFSLLTDVFQPYFPIWTHFLFASAWSLKWNHTVYFTSKWNSWHSWAVSHSQRPWNFNPSSLKTDWIISITKAALCILGLFFFYHGLFFLSFILTFLMITTMANLCVIMIKSATFYIKCNKVGKLFSLTGLDNAGN